jgi:AcrR family transcriptional regulator
MSPRKVDKQKKKNEIMMAAMQVFAKKGLKNTKMVDIAVAAGIGKGTIYEYFRSRDTIFVEACNLFTIDMMDRMRSTAQSGLTPPEKIKKMCESLLEITNQFSPEMTSIMIDLWSEGIRGNIENPHGLIDIRPLYDEAGQIYQQVLEEGIKQGHFRAMDTFSVASILIGMIDGIQIQLVLHPKLFDLKQLSTKLMNLIIHGIENKPLGG